MTTSDTTPTLSTGQSPFDLIVGFYQTVFTLDANETPAHKQMVKAVIEQAFAPGYTYNGEPMAPDALWGWRESFFKRFDQMVFRVHHMLSGPVSVVSPTELSGVAMRWTVDALDTAGTHWRIDGMSLLSVGDGKAVSNVQLGDADKGWYRVAGDSDEA